MTLNVTNGDAAVPQLRAGGVEGEILCWRDVLHDGPLPAADWDSVRMARAQFIGSLGWAPAQEVLRGFTMRDGRLLAAARDGEPIVLWFEHDLYDQLQLAQVLAMLAEQPGASVQLAQAHDYLGQMDADAVASLAGERHLVDEEMLGEGAEAWRALTASSPESLERFARAQGTLPLLHRAASRLLEEYPASGTGLSRSEAQALGVIGAGSCTLADAYRRSHHAMEEATWMGDSSFLVMLARLSGGADPVVAYDDGTPITGKADRDTFSRRVVLTPLGRSILSGDADLVNARGVDRWIGGVHLQGRSVPWRRPLS